MGVLRQLRIRPFPLTSELPTIRPAKVLGICKHPGRFGTAVLTLEQIVLLGCDHRDYSGLKEHPTGSVPSEIISPEMGIALWKLPFKVAAATAVYGMIHSLPASRTANPQLQPIWRTK